MEKTFSDCLKPIIGMPPNFVHGETFTDGSQTSKSMKVFFLKSFALYDNSVHLLLKSTTDSHKGQYGLFDFNVMFSVPVS